MIPVRMAKQNQFDLLMAILKQVKVDEPGIIQLIEQQVSDSKKAGKPKEVLREVTRRLRIQNKKLLEQVASLREQLKQNKSDRNQILGKLAYLMKLNNALAEALGSCNNCWGDDPECVHCSGNGSPGWRNINKRMFNLYILPTLEKLYGLKRILK